MSRKPTNKKKQVKYQDNLDDDFDFGQKDNKKSTPILHDVDIKIEYKNANQKLLGDLIKTKEIIIASGGAGCGKTWLMCAEALRLVKENPTKYKKIYLIKSVTTLLDQEIGYLKGGLEDKMEPFIFSFMHNIKKIIGDFNAISLLENKTIEIMPLAYLRGINLDECVILADEIQNMSLDLVKTLFTRIGYNAKMICALDPKQIDMRNKNNSSALIVIDKFKDKEGFGTMQFTKKDIVRNPIIEIVEDTFDEIFEEIKKEMK